MRKRWIGVLLVFLGLAVLPAKEAESGSGLNMAVQFKARATVQKETIFLADIATVKGAPRSLVDKIGRLRIGESPDVGEVLLLSREEIVSRVQKANLSSYISSKSIPEEIEVTREGRLVEKEEMVQVLEETLRNLLPDPRKTLAIQEVQGFEAFILPPGPYTSEVILPESAHRGGPMTVTLSLFQEGRLVQKLRVRVRVEIQGFVVAARTGLRRHQEIGENDVHLIKKNLSLLPPDVVTDLKNAVGKRLTLSVNGQEALRSSMVETPPLVKKGDRVILVIDHSYFKITTFGEVKEDGRRGEWIKLVNISSKKEVHGRVVDAHTVQVEF
ncbi:MAG: flagellar basal body P-ring formation protein FlgA [Deltaproteobacteria bacterium]|nr:MAG: flagellar basal body P-ring formation protein FlgA [Deltaproteobacteria bacterium]